MQVAFKKLEQEYGSLSHQVEGVMQMHGQKLLAGGDGRFGWPTWNQITQYGLDPIKDWFGRQLNEAPFELAVVGDFDPEALVLLVARYLGALPARIQVPASDQGSEVKFPTGQVFKLSAETDIDKALVAIVYPTADYWDIQRTRRLNLLAELFTERLRVRIREKLGAAYSPFAYHRPFRAYRGHGLLQAYIQVDPRQVQAVLDEVKQIAAGMAVQGISVDELRRALDPTLAQIKDLRQTNTYWLNSVLTGASRHPEQLAWARTIESDYATISVEEMNALARRYLDNQKAAVITILPQPSVTK
jgi:zinc protease